MYFGGLGVSCAYNVAMCLVFFFLSLHSFTLTLPWDIPCLARSFLPSLGHALVFPYINPLLGHPLPGAIVSFPPWDMPSLARSFPSLPGTYLAWRDRSWIPLGPTLPGAIFHGYDVDPLHFVLPALASVAATAISSFIAYATIDCGHG